MRRNLTVVAWSGLCGLIAIAAEHATTALLTRYLRRHGL